MRRIFRRLAVRLSGTRSPSEWAPTRNGESERWAALGASMIEGMKAGMEQVDARRAELLASGKSPEEAQAALLQEMLSDPGLPAMLEYSRGVVMRSFGTLYEDEDEDAEAGGG